MFLSLPPRPVTPEWRAHFRRSVIGVLFLAAVGIAFLFGCVGAHESYQRALWVIDTGTRTSGTVLVRDTTRNKNSTTYYITYHFDVDGAPYEARHTVSREDFNNHPEGRRIEVAYDALNPHVSYLVCERSRQSFAGVVILALFGLGALTAAALVWYFRARHRWLWTHGVEVAANYSWNRPAGYVFHFDGVNHHVKAPAGQWVVRDGERYMILVDPAKPTRVTGVTPVMMTPDRLAEATMPESRLLAPVPRDENREWRKGIRTLGYWVGGIFIGIIALGIFLGAGPILFERVDIRSRALEVQGVVVSRSPTAVEYLVGRKLASFRINKSEVHHWLPGRPVTAFELDGRLHALHDVSYTGPVAGLVIGILLAALAVWVVLAGLRQHWRGRVLWQHGIEVHAAVTSDAVNKGVRTIGYRFAHGGLTGTGSRQFPTSDDVVYGQSAELQTVVVLVDPLDARRSRLVLQRERR